jgi:hypothetical protein
MDGDFMGWIDALPEVGDPIRKERAKLQQLAEQATELERHALALRGQVRAGQAALGERVARNWATHDIEAAQSAARRARSLARSPAAELDVQLRRELDALDGAHLAAEALQAFHAGGVMRQANLLSTATDEERRAAVVQVLTWWNEAALPVLERLEAGRGVKRAHRASV